MPIRYNSQRDDYIPEARADGSGLGFVTDGREINTTSPLTGGGDLSADRTISFLSQTANTVLAGATSGGSTAPAFRALVSADLPADGVTNAKLANMADGTVKGRAIGAGTGDPTDIAQGAGGGFSADLLDGFQTATAGGTPSTIPVTNGSGLIPSSFTAETLALSNLTDVSGTTGSGSTAVLGTSPTIATPYLTGYIEGDEASAPSTPASGKGRWYISTSGLPRFINDAGLDVDLSFSSGAYDPSVHLGGNMIANWPPLTGQDGAQPEWWEEEDANVNVTDEDIIGEGIADDIHKRTLKVVGGASGANKYVYQRLNIADHDQLDTGTVISASIWVWQPDAATAKLELVGSVSGSLGSATTTATGAWTLLKVEGKTVGASDVYVDIRISTNANSDTSYWQCPYLGVGTVVRPWSENPIRLVQALDDTISVDPANTNFTTASFATPSHPLACILNLAINLSSTGGVRSLRIEAAYSSGSTTAIYNTAQSTSGANVSSQVRLLSHCSDTQVIQWRVSNADVNTLAISLNSYFRFAN